jgi:hypothetical protein
MWTRRRRGDSGRPPDTFRATGDVHPPRKNSPLSALSSRRRHFPRRAFISSSACSAVKLSYRRPSLSGEAEAPARRAVWHRRRATGSGSTESATRTTFPLPDRGAEGNRHRPGSAGRSTSQPCWPRMSARKMEAERVFAARAGSGAARAILARTGKQRRPRVGDRLDASELLLG